MRVFVMNKRGAPLMPTSQRRARILLKEGKANIVKYQPFTIQLTYATGEATQQANIGVDAGAKHVGVAVTSGTVVIAKGEIHLRDDVKKEIMSRKELRRGRRNRKTRYRAPRFLNRRRPAGWLPPSIQSRTDNTINWIEKFAVLVPNPKVTVEAGKFDMQKIINPDIRGKEYQQGNTYQFWNDRYYIFARDNYTCVVCKDKGEGKRLRTHHIIPRKDGGSDRVGNQITICEKCHIGYHNGKIKHKFSEPKEYKEMPFMNIIRQRVLQGTNYGITYGNITQVNRGWLGLDKSHCNDAIAISGASKVTKDCKPFCIKQVRVKKRSLHESTPRKGRKTKNIEAKRNAKNTPYQNGLYLNDRVMYGDRIGFVSGFCKGGVYVKDINGGYIVKEGKGYKQLPPKEVKFVKHTRGWQWG